MIALIWNMRGFGRKGRRTQLKDFLRRVRVDIICLQETLKTDFSDPELRSLEFGDRFHWCWLPVNGHSVGILLGVRDSTMEVGNLDRGQYFLSNVVYHRATKFKWEFIGVCGLANHALSGEFLLELEN